VEVRVIAYKFLAAGSVGPFSGFAWPTGTPGPWVEASGTAHACFAGVHGCSVEHLPFWLHEELWEIELEAPVAAEHKLVAPRGRLVRRVDAWDAGARLAYGASCLERVGPLVAAAPEPVAQLVAGIVEDLCGMASRGAAASAGFCAARIAELVGGIGAYDAERAAQSRWLVERLSLGA
jgi:hypothetical protein